jgi:hypothetical protein
MPTLNDDFTAMTGQRVYMDFTYKFPKKDYLGFGSESHYIMKDIWIEPPILKQSGIKELKQVNAIVYGPAGLNSPVLNNIEEKN